MASESEVIQVEIHNHHDEAGEEQLNHKSDDIVDGELSPTSLRRSTRTSALKAQEKLKVKEMVVLDSQAKTEQPTEEIPQTSDEVNPVSKKKKRKLATGDELDQYDCKFGIRLDSNADVCLLTDESDISSLNSEEVADMRDKYKAMQEDAEKISDEVVRQREVQVREMEAALRLEEAKLSMLKKLRQNQQNAQKPLQQPEVAKKLVNQNSLGNAYKPAVAAPNNKVNGVSRNAKSAKPPGNTPQISLNPQQQQILQQIIRQSGGNPTQMAQLLRSLTPSALAALQQTVQASQQQQQTQHQSTAVPSTANAKAAAADTNRSARDSVIASQQRINAARQQLRLHQESQLKQVPLPKAPVPDLSFIPNGNQPDFCYLLGLDLAVQRMLKDKTVHKKVEVDPYTCEECGTDFTPVWKAIAGDKGDLHLYCEHCLRQAQKRRVRQDQMSMVRKAFQKMQEQEKEFERQVTAGKFAETAAARPSSSATPPVTAKANVVQNNSSPAAVHKAELATTSTTNANPQPRLPTTNTVQRGQNSTQKQKRSSNANANNNAAALAALNNLSSSPALQQQLATIAALRQANPMIAAMLASNPAMLVQLQQMWSQMLSTPRMPSAAASNPAMAALMQAVAQSAQNNSVNTSNATSSSNSSNSSSGGGNAMNQLLNMFNAAQNPLMNMNPQLIRQMQAVAQSTQAAQLQHMRELASKSGKK